MGFQYYEKNLDPQQLVSSEEESAKRFVNSERQTVNRLFACSTTIRRLSFSLYFFRYAPPVLSVSKDALCSMRFCPI